ncbi:MAG TPA: tetratricopeptide repeat protein [Gammaproteobacteria bacterium]|nr:tetratricopeptide repeat protein [Gammaproteobacteria bacterium]
MKNNPDLSREGDDALLLARRSLDQGDPWGALDSCREYCARNGNDADALDLLGQCLASTGDLPGAGNAVDRAIRIAPDRARYYIHLGEVNVQMGRAREALGCFQHAMQLAPQDAGILNDSAMALWGMGRLEDARSLLQRAVEADPGNLLVRRNMRLVSARMIDHWHFAMLNDDARNTQFEAAIRRAVQKGSRVLDIGAGSGLLSMMAARAGATQVTACEVNPALAGQAREMIRDNGYSDRVRVLNKLSQQIDPDTDFPPKTRPDVLLAEVFDTLLIGEGALATIDHARRHLLAPGATVIPCAGELYGVLLESESLWREGAVDSVSGFDLAALNRFRPDTVSLSPAAAGGRVLSDDACIFSFDFTAEAGASPDSVRLDIPVRNKGMCHGLLVWFRLQLDDELTFDNRPQFEADGLVSDNRTHWQPVVKLLVPALPVEPGMTIRVEARHNRSNVALQVYDPVSGEPLG